MNIAGLTYFWTDSTIVKCWLSSLPSRWNSFVANRVSEIQHITKSGTWRHVSGVENPADIISRGMTPAQLQYQSVWFEGPTWLRQDESVWPQSEITTTEVDKSVLEERSTTTLSVHSAQQNEIFSLRSSFTDLVRLVAYLRRFIYNARTVDVKDRRKGFLSHEEYHDSVATLVRLSQLASFPQEIAALRKQRALSASSRLRALHPRLMNDIIVVGGRLANASIAENRKHPMILHHHHPLTKSLMVHYHVKHFHAGQQLLIASVRANFWPTNARALARKVVHECVVCFRSKPTAAEQLMADLPSVRVNPSAVFENVGIDFCGPFYIRYPVRRSVAVKCFVAIFVCLVTKAVHLEVVADLSTQAFLSAFKRFVGIRGKPAVVMCDNATNFVGANHELQDLRHQLADQQFQHTITSAALEDGISFKFIPARSPTFGGLWEAAVKSFKGHFRKTIGTNPLTYDGLSTVVQQVAAILNSRPLTPLSEDPNDYSALTPGHFLIGRPLTAVCEPDLQEVPHNRLSLWQRNQTLIQQIWRKWSTEYLSNLHNRTKWTKQRDNIKVGTMVVVKEDNLPPLKWRLGRIAEVFSGSDGNIRVVLVRTKDGCFKRAISKICVLPIKDNLDTSSTS